MSVTIFLPSEYFYVKESFYIYGDIQICENNVISYYIVHGSPALPSGGGEHQQQRLLGHIVGAGATEQPYFMRDDAPLKFAYNTDAAAASKQQQHIYLTQLGIKPTADFQVNLYLYERANILRLQFLQTSPKVVAGDNSKGYVDQAAAADLNNDFNMLHSLLSRNAAAAAAAATQHYRLRRRRRGNEASLTWRSLTVTNILLAIPALLTQFFIWLMDCHLVRLLLARTSLYKHYDQWRCIHKTRLRNTNIAVDRALGVIVMLLLLWYIDQPYGDFLIKNSHMVINQLRRLLHALKGSPVGLKLNVHLNNFLLDCFNYHVDLWATFLDLIEPLVRKLLLPIGLLGCMGFSYQLALLADLISIVGLHAQCFYIYTEVLYKVETKALQILWKMVLGKRWNKLKNRMESYNFINRQLYLATIFFTSMLFLFPTIFAFYVVFVALRSVFLAVFYALQYMREQLLKFPLDFMFKWLCGKFYELSSLKIRRVTTIDCPPTPAGGKFRYAMCVFELRILTGTSVRRAYNAGQLALNNAKYL